MKLSVNSDIAKDFILPFLAPVFDFFGKYYLSSIFVSAIIVLPFLIVIFLRAKKGPARKYFRIVLGFAICVCIFTAIRDEINFVQAKQIQLQIDNSKNHE